MGIYEYVRLLGRKALIKGVNPGARPRGNNKTTEDGKMTNAKTPEGTPNRLMEAHLNIVRAMYMGVEQLIDEAVREHQHEMRIRGRNTSNYSWAYVYVNNPDTMPLEDRLRSLNISRTWTLEYLKKALGMELAKARGNGFPTGYIAEELQTVIMLDLQGDNVVDEYLEKHKDGIRILIENYLSEFGERGRGGELPAIKS